MNHAGHQFVARQRLQRFQIDQHGRRLVEGAHQVLSRGGVDPGLAAHRGVHHAQQSGRDVNDVDPAQPGRRREAGNVGGRSPAKADDRIFATDADAPQHLPDEGHHGKILARFGVGKLDPVGVNPVVREPLPDQLRSVCEYGLMQDDHLVAGAQQTLDLVQQSVADDAGVRRINVDVDGDRRAGMVCHLRTPARRAARVAGVSAGGTPPPSSGGALSTSASASSHDSDEAGRGSD